MYHKLATPRVSYCCAVSKREMLISYSSEERDDKIIRFYNITCFNICVFKELE